jgi:thiamine-monophosphate kinase
MPLRGNAHLPSVDEAAFITALRGIALSPEARGLRDDAALLGDLILTHDTIVEGVHYLPSDPPESVAWKLVAVNLSDLAAKGAAPVAALMSYTLTGDDAWDAGFVAGLGEATRHFGIPLIGGDTVGLPKGNARVTGMTAIGRSSGTVPSRSGARVGDALFVTGVIGDAGLGLKIAQALAAHDEALLRAYQWPQPQLAAGALLAPFVTAMMDVSDGLLIDATRLGEASGVGVVIDLDAIPLSPAFRARAGDSQSARLIAATAGDDYQLLFTSALPLPSLPCSVTRIGHIASGAGLKLVDHLGNVAVPDVRGWEHL